MSGMRTGFAAYAAAFCLGLAAPVWGADADSASNPASDPASNPVVAEVNQNTIRLSDVDAARDLLPPALQNAPLDQVYDMLLDSLINSHLAAAKAKGLGLDETPQYKQRMARVGEQVLERMLLTQYIEQRLTEERIQDRYVKLVEDAEGQMVLWTRHILVQSEEAAAAVMAKLDDGDDFVELAREFSVGPRAKRGGDLGWLSPGRMGPGFNKAAQALSVGAVTAKPVRTRFGWHIIKVEGRRAYQPPSFAEVRAELVNELSAELGQTLMETLRGDARIAKTPLKALSVK